MERHIGRGSVVVVLILLLALVLVTSISLAQPVTNEDTVAGIAAESQEIEITKEVTPTAVIAGDPVTYTVTFSNTGGVAGGLDRITDTLPAGFTFLGMAAGSDVTQAPVSVDGSMVWTAPVTIPSSATLELIYQAETAVVGDELAPANRVEALLDGTLIGPAQAIVELYTTTKTIFLPLVPRDWSAPYFTATKDASPDSVDEGDEVIYTVVFHNEGDMAGILARIEDTLPAGFTFLKMEGGSDVAANPTGTTGTIVWEGPFTVDAHDHLTVVYRVQAASAGGDFVNSVTAEAQYGTPPKEPATASVYVKPSILFADDFENGIGNWTPFTNYWRLNETQWFWDMGQGVRGSHGYTNYGNAGVDPERPERGAHDSVSMLLVEGAEEWTDYRYKAKFNLIGGRLAGVWFRGQYEEVDTPGQWITGYYFTIKVRNGDRTDDAQLWQLRTFEERGDEGTDEYLYHFSNPIELEEVHLQTPIEENEWHEITVIVEGNHIKCYVDEELAIDFVDDEGSIFLKGTVGFFTYGKWPDNVAVVKFDDVLVEPLE